MKNTHLLFFLFLTISAYSQHADTTLDVAEIDSLFAKVDQANGQRDFDQSFELLDQVEEKILPVFGKESLNYANYLHKRGEVFNIQGAYAEVETALARIHCYPGKRFRENTSGLCKKFE